MMLRRIGFSFGLRPSDRDLDAIMSHNGTYPSEWNVV